MNNSSQDDLQSAAGKSRIDVPPRDLINSQKFSKDSLLPGLIIAVRDGVVDEVKRLITEGADVDESTQDGLTPLMMAISMGHLEIAKILKNSGANIRKEGKNGYTALQLAIKQNSRDAISLLLDWGAEINARSEKCRLTALMLAFECAEDNIISLLIERSVKGEVNTRSWEGKTALMYAVEKESITFVQQLIDKKADVNQIDQSHNHTALVYAIEKKSLPLVLLLLENQAQVRVNSLKDTILNIAIRAGSTEIVSLLLERDANLREANKFGETPLLVAIKSHNKPIVTMILDMLLKSSNEEALKSINSGNGVVTTLMVAIEAGDESIVTLLLQNGVNVDDTSLYEQTALIFAIKLKAIKMAELLLVSGADPNLKNRRDESPLAVAVLAGSVALVSLLLEHGAKPSDKNRSDYGDSVIIAAIESNQPLEIVSLLLSKGADANARNMSSLTAPMVAVEKGSEELVSLLLDHGADVNKPNSLILGKGTCLLVAVQKESLSMTSLLLSRGADPNASVSGSDTALVAAVKMDSISLTSVLLNNRADPNAISRRYGPGDTALLVATEKESPELISLLLAKGANPTFKPNGKQAPLVRAIEKGSYSTASLFLDYMAKSRANSKPGALSFKDGNRSISMVSSSLERGSGIMKMSPGVERDALIAAVNQNSLDFVNLLLDKDVDFDSAINDLSHEGAFQIALKKKFSDIAAVLFLQMRCDNFVPGINMFCDYIKGSETKITVTNAFLKRFGASFDEDSDRKRRKHIVFRMLRDKTCWPQFLRGCILLYGAINSAAARNESERSDLEVVVGRFGSTMLELFNTDCFDIDKVDLMQLLENPSFRDDSSIYFAKPKAYALCDTSLLILALENDVKAIFETAQVRNVLHTIFEGFSLRQSADTDYIKSWLLRFRFGPRNMLFLELLCYAFQIVLILKVSWSYGHVYEKQFGSSFFSSDFNREEVMLAFYYFSGVFYEIGEALHWSGHFKLAKNGYIIAKRHFSDDWNVLDFISVCLGLLWFFLRLNASTFGIARVVLSLTAIPQSLGLLRFLSINKTLGVLVITIKQFLKDLSVFVIVYLVVIMGFGIALRGLFYESPFYNSTTETFITLFSGTLQNFDFSAFDAESLSVNSIGITLLIVYEIFTAVLMINLLIARMSESYSRISVQSLREWSFENAKILKRLLLEYERHPFCILPPPLNILTILVTLGGFKESIPIKINNEDRLISIGGTAVNCFFYMPVTLLNPIFWAMDNIWQVLFKTDEDGQLVSRFHSLLLPFFVVIYIVLSIAAYPILAVVAIVYEPFRVDSPVLQTGFNCNGRISYFGEVQLRPEDTWISASAQVKDALLQAVNQETEEDSDSEISAVITTANPLIQLQRQDSFSIPEIEMTSSETQSDLSIPMDYSSSADGRETNSYFTEKDIERILLPLVKSDGDVNLSTNSIKAQYVALRKACSELETSILSQESKTMDSQRDELMRRQVAFEQAVDLRLQSIESKLDASFKSILESLEKNR